MRTVRLGRASLMSRALMFLLVAGSGPAQWALAQSNQAPTQAQLEVFRNLPPDQQQAVLEAMSGSSPDDISEVQPATPDGVVPGRVAPSGRLVPRGPVRTEPGATLIVSVEVDPAFESETMRRVVEQRRDQIRKANPFALDDEARLHLPFLPPIAVGGLTEKEAAQLLNADPRLLGLEFTVALLPVEPVGHEALKPFGYDLFDENPGRFAPSTEGAAPTRYVVGPGDNINVDLYGKKTARYRLVVGRDGALTIPDLGPVRVAGKTFDEVHDEIAAQISEQLIGVRASVSMGQLRSLRVFIVGDVRQPGSHPVGGLSTITSALFASGGVTDVGSLRNIELKRRGAVVTRFDLYDLLLRGDTSKDLTLQEGDAILVPPVGPTAGVMGQVHRPAIYEFREGTVVADLVSMAGGLKADSSRRDAKLERIDAHGARVVLDINLSSDADLGRRLRAGDVLRVPKVLDEFAIGVTLDGHVHRPGPYAWREGMRLTDLLGGLDGLKFNADQRYILIRREVMPDRRVEVISADAVAAFAARGSAADPLLESHDRVVVFNRQADRGPGMSVLLDEMRLQARDNRPVPIVSVSGRVRSPGDYPLETGMRVSDLVRAGGGMDEAAYPLAAELTRYEVQGGEKRQTSVVNLDLRGMSKGDAADLPLMPYDVLVVKEVPDWREQESVIIRGQVRFPGTYPIRHGETLSSLIERAGGLTSDAFPRGSIFLREEIKVQEREQIETLTHRMQADLALLSLQNAQTKDPQSNETLAAGQALLQQLRGSVPKGRLVVDLEKALSAKGSDDDIELRSGDTLMVPRLKQYVTVIGEVQNSTAHVWKRDLKRAAYIDMSGGTTTRADDDRIYVVRANGGVEMAASKRKANGAALEPGDTIVVPLDTERVRPLHLWTAVTTVIYNLAVAVAAIGSL
jgi:protein involved in polysaccharide export with SLBB domain